jgi:hypothetical protein
MSLVTRDAGPRPLIPKTPRIMRGTGSCLLPCGCLVGFYETYSGQTVSVVDAREQDCANNAHRVGFQVREHGLRPR